MKRYELTKAQWERVKKLLPPERTRKRGRPRKDDRRIMKRFAKVLTEGEKRQIRQLDEPEAD